MTSPTITRTPTTIRKGTAAMLAMFAVLLGGVGLAEQAGAYERVGTQAPCWVIWPAAGKKPTLISCSQDPYFKSVKGYVKGKDWKEYSKTSNVVGITTHGKLARNGFIVCHRSWRGECKYSGSANP